MKAKLNPFVVDAAGNQQGYVYSKNHYGLYIKKWYQPTQIQSDETNLAHYNFKFYSQRWSAISDVNRIKWNELAKQIPAKCFDGSTRNKTGKNVFVSCNCNLNRIGVSQIDTPGRLQPFNSFYKLYLVFTHIPDKFRLYPTAVDTTGNVEALVFITSPLSLGTFYTHCQYKWIAHFPLAAPYYDILFTDYNVRFGYMPKNGKKYFVKVICIDKQSGLASEPVQTSVIY
jgi:hypothetical protein